MYLDQRKNHYNARDFRAHLKDHLSSTQPLTIGTRWTVRAFLIPLPEFYERDAAQRRRAFAKAKRDFLQLLTEIRNLD
jgi:hypothetical protein